MPSAHRFRRNDDGDPRPAWSRGGAGRPARRRGPADTRPGTLAAVLVPDDVRAELVAHSEAEAPNEACGLVLVREGRAERYVPARNAAASPYRFELALDDPEVWFAEDDGYELAVFHSHLSSPARPSRTDVENIGLWAGKPYLILSVRTGELAAWTISGGEISPLPLR